MNCLECRRRLLTDPCCNDPAVKHHVATCTSCKLWTDALARQEEALRLAMKVAVPENLAERVLLSAQLRARRPRRMALAAMLVLAVGVGAGGWGLRTGGDASGWSEVVLRHVLEEIYTLSRDDDVPAARLQTALAEYSLAVVEPVGGIQYLDHCELPGGWGLHIVVRSPQAGQVSLIVAPAGVMPEQEAPAKRAGLSARMVLLGKVAIGIVTPHSADDARVEAWLRNSLVNRGA